MHPYPTTAPPDMLIAIVGANMSIEPQGGARVAKPICVSQRTTRASWISARAGASPSCHSFKTGSGFELSTDRGELLTHRGALGGAVAFAYAASQRGDERIVIGVVFVEVVVVGSGSCE